MTPNAAARLLAALAVALLVACGGDEADEAEEGRAPDTSAAEADAGAARSPRDGVAAVGTTLFFDDPTPPVADALARYEAECAGEATPECKRLQWQLEYALYEDMRELARAGTVDEELIHVGAAAECPQLKAFSLDRIRERGLRPEEHALVVAAFDDPYPSVRASAQYLAQQLPDEKWTRMLVRDSGAEGRGVQGLIAGVTPGAKSLGAPLYPGSTHWHFASSASHGEFFSTPDAPDDVVAFYAKDGKQALSGEQLEAEIEEAMNALQNPMLLVQKMQEAAAAGQDPATVIASLTAGAAGAEIDWTDGIAGREGMLEPRYVVLAEGDLMGQPIPSRVVAIFRDEAMGATGLIFRSKPATAASSDLTTPEGVAAFMRVQEVLGSPNAQLD